MAEKTLLRRFADMLTSVWPFGAGGTLPTEPLVADPKMLRDAQAYVDPSRLFGGKLSLPYNPSVLVTRKGLNIYDQMKLDPQVKSALLFKKHAVLASGWEVISPGDQPEDWEVTTMVRDCFTMLPGGMTRVLRALMLGIDYGYSITEKVYSEGSGSLKGKLALARLISAKPHYFDFATDAHGQILMLLQKYVPGRASGGASAFLEFPPDKFVVYTHQQEFENPYGRSDLEAAYMPWWVKDNAYKWLAVALERYGMPPLFLMYNPNTYQDAQVGELKKIVKGIQNATLGVIPRGQKDDLEFWSAQLGGQAKDIFIGALQHFDADIAKALLQPSLTGFSGEGTGAQSHGSLARANVSWKAFMYIVKEIQTQLTTVINEQVVRQLCDLNYPNLQSYPQFKFARLDEETQLELFNTWLALVEGKVVNRIEDDEPHIRAALGFPENENPVLEPLPTAATPGGGKDKIPGIPDAKVLQHSELSEEMRAFAEETGGTWVDVGGQVACYAEWDESKHPRQPSGTDKGGKFAPNLARMAEVKFLEHARALGFGRKVIGDNAYTNKHGQQIKLLGARGGKLQIHQEGRGRYEVDYN
jgi:hypothetical protein